MTVNNIKSRDIIEETLSGSKQVEDPRVGPVVNGKAERVVNHRYVSSRYKPSGFGKVLTDNFAGRGGYSGYATPYDKVTSNWKATATDNSLIARERRAFWNMAWYLDSAGVDIGDDFSRDANACHLYENRGIGSKGLAEIQCENVLLYMTMQEQFQRNGITNMVNRAPYGTDYYRPGGPVYRGLAISHPDLLKRELGRYGIDVVTDKQYDSEHPPVGRDGSPIKKEYTSDGWDLDAPVLDDKFQFTSVKYDFDTLDHRRQRAEYRQQRSEQRRLPEGYADIVAQESQDEADNSFEA